MGSGQFAAHGLHCSYLWPMSPAERKKLITMVVKKIKETELQVAEYKELTQPIAPDDAIGRISRMDAINNKSVNEAALRTAETKLIGLKRILDKKDDSDLGVCSACKQDIPMRRLLLVPQSVKCVRCASR